MRLGAELERKRPPTCTAMEVDAAQHGDLLTAIKWSPLHASVSACFGVRLGAGLDEEEVRPACKASDIDALESDLLTASPVDPGACLSTFVFSAFSSYARRCGARRDILGGPSRVYSRSWQVPRSPGSCLISGQGKPLYSIMFGLSLHVCAFHCRNPYIRTFGTCTEVWSRKGQPRRTLRRTLLHAWAESATFQHSCVAVCAHFIIVICVSIMLALEFT